MRLHSKWPVLPVLAAFAMALGGLVAPDLAHAKGKPIRVCGDDKRTRGEDCDGTDDRRCPGQCSVTCTCGAPTPDPTPIEVYGAWHCGDDFCTWATVRDTSPEGEFDIQNHWLIDRGDGFPSVNLVVLSFVDPLKLLNRTTDTVTLNGVQRGMTQDVVDYFKNKGIRVMLSIGGFTYVDYWNEALASDPTQLGLNAAALAMDLGVGIEIDYEENTNPDLEGLQLFIDAYRSVHPYDASGNDHAARLTIDLAAGDRFLIATARRATEDWLADGTRVLDYANATVAGSRNPNSASQITDRWQEHVDGKPQFAPPILPLAPAKFTGGLFVVEGSNASPECSNFAASHISDTGNFLQTVAPNGDGTTNGMLGYMFWAAECPSARRICTTPPDSCELGVGVGASFYNIPIPMPPLRQN